MSGIVEEGELTEDRLTGAFLELARKGRGHAIAVVRVGSAENEERARAISASSESPHKFRVIRAGDFAPHHWGVELDAE